VPRTVVIATTGWIVEHTGWVDFFLLCTILAVPGMVLLLRVAPWRETGVDAAGAAGGRMAG
jgi:PAT family beta-lactamase induction signal transducer AmpG